MVNKFQMEHFGGPQGQNMNSPKKELRKVWGAQDIDSHRAPSKKGPSGFSAEVRK